MPQGASSRHSIREPQFLSDHKGILMIPTSDPAKSSFLVDLVLSGRPPGAVTMKKVSRGWQGSPGTGTPTA